MITYKDISEFIHSVEPHASGRLHAYQKAKVPTFMDLQYSIVDRYMNNESTLTSIDIRRYLCLKVSELQYKAQSFNGINEYYDNVPLTQLVQEEKINPFLLFINGKFIKWSKIKLIKTKKENFLVIEETTLLRTTIESVDIINIPFNIYYSETGPLEDNDIIYIFKFGTDGLLKTDSSITYTHIGIKNTELYLEEGSGTSINYHVCTLNPIYPAFEENVIVFNNGMITHLDVKMNIGNILSINEGNTGSYIYKLFYDMSGNRSKDNLISFSAFNRSELAGYIQEFDNGGTYPVWLPDMIKKFDITPLSYDILDEVTQNELLSHDSSKHNVYATNSNLIVLRHCTQLVGSNTDALAIGGDITREPSGELKNSTTEAFNGTTWSLKETMNHFHMSHGACGTTSNTLVAGGIDTLGVDATFIGTNVEKYDGTAWSNGPSLLNTTTNTLHTTAQACPIGDMCGLMNAAVYIAPIVKTDTNYMPDFEKFNGNTWSIMTKYPNNYIRMYHSTCGRSNDIMNVGGASMNANGAYYPNIVDHYDGYVWDVMSARINKPRYGSRTIGKSASAMLNGGINGNKESVLETEMYNGSVWYIGYSLHKCFFTHGACGTPTAPLIAGGSSSYNASAISLLGTQNSINNLTILDTPFKMWKIEDNLNNPTAYSEAVGSGNSILNIAGTTDDVDLTAYNGTEYYDGNAWGSYKTPVIPRMRFGAAGIFNNAIITSGETSSENDSTEIFNGSVWASELVNPTTRRYSPKMIGIASSSILLGGSTDADNVTNVNNTESFNGTVWSAGIDMNENRSNFAACGGASTILVSGSITDSYSSDSAETFNGTTWTIIADMNQQRYAHTLVGDSTSAMCIGGMNSRYPDFGINMTETWNGTAWSMDFNSMPNIPKHNHTSADTMSAGGISYQLNTPITESYKSYNASPEEYYDPIWTVAPPMQIAKACSVSIGTPFDALAVAGYNRTSSITSAEKFNGSIWSNTAECNYSRYQHAGCGTPTSSIIVGGYNDESLLETDEIFNGNAWSNINTMNTVRRLHSACGVSNNALAVGGFTGSAHTNSTETFNGTTWSSGIDMNTVRSSVNVVGESSSALAIGGSSDGTVNLNSAESFNGLVWTNEANMLTARSRHASCGTANNAITTGGMISANASYNQTEVFNTIAWRIANTMNITKQFHSLCGSSSNAISSGLMPASSFCEWLCKANSNILSPNVVSHWSMTTGMNTVRFFHATEGVRDNAISIGGSADTRNLKTTETFNGKTWTNSADLSKSKYGLSSVGAANSCLAIGGVYYGIIPIADMDDIVMEPTGNALNEVESYNGTTWSSFDSTSIAHFVHGSVGNKDACTIIDEDTGEVYNSATWSTFRPIPNDPRTNIGCCGFNNNILMAGGYGNLGLNTDTSVEKYNGYTWTNQPNLLIGRIYPSLMGKSDSAIMSAGYSIIHESTIDTEYFDGNTWSVDSFMNMYRETNGASGTSSNAIATGGMLYIGGDYRAYLDSVETFTRVEHRFDESLLDDINSYNSTMLRDLYKKNSNISMDRMSAANLVNANNNTYSFNTRKKNGKECGTMLTIEGLLYSDFELSNGKYTMHNMHIPTDTTVWKANSYNLSERIFGASSGTAYDALIATGIDGQLNILNSAERVVDDVTRVSTATSTPRVFASMVGLYSNSLLVGGKTTYVIDTPPYNSIELFNGNTWSTSSSVMNEYRSNSILSGSPTNALAVSGVVNFVENAVSGNYEYRCTYATELFNGVTWSIVRSINAARRDAGGCGSSNNTFVSGGQTEDNSSLSSIEVYNGTVWSAEVVELLVPMINHTASGNGSTAINVGGDPTGDPASLNVYFHNFDTLAASRYNGTICETMSVKPGYHHTCHSASSNSSDSILIMCGYGTPTTTMKYAYDNKEEGSFNTPIFSSHLVHDHMYLNERYVTIPEKSYDIIFFRDLDMIQKKASHAQVGLLDDVFTFGGYSGGDTNVSLLYNGVDWYSKASMNTDRNGLSGCGVSNDCLATGGSTVTTELFNGTSWTAGYDMNTSRFNHNTIGTANDAVSIFGCNTMNMEKFNGSTWVQSDIFISNLYTANSNAAGVGLANSFLTVGGSINNTVLYNGLTFILAGQPNYNRMGCGVSGKVNYSLLSNGQNESNQFIMDTERFDGLNWIIDGQVNINRNTNGYSGSNNGFMISGGITTDSAVTFTCEIGKKCYKHYISSDDTMEITSFTNIQNKTVRGKIDLMQDQTIVDPEIDKTTMQVFITTDEKPYEVEYHKTTNSDGTLSVVIDDGEEHAVTDEFIFANPNQFRSRSFTVAYGDYIFPLGDEFDTCSDKSHYMIFMNGRRISAENFDILFFDKDRPYDTQYVVMYSTLTPGDIISAFYLPYPILEIVYQTELPNDGKLMISEKTTSNMPMLKDILQIYINGKKIYAEDIEEIDSTHILIKNTESIKNVSILKFMDDNETLIESYLSNDSIYDTLVASMGDNTALDMLGIGSIQISNSEIDVNAMVNDEAAVWTEISRDFYNAVNGINHLGFENTMGTTVMVTGEDSTGTDIIPTGNATTYTNLPIPDGKRTLGSES